MQKEQTTLENILEAGKHEFMEKDFQTASLRKIVRDAGVTTGAFYGYFSGKEALFDALVGNEYDVLMSRYKNAQQDFANLPPEEQPDNMGKQSGDYMEYMVEIEVKSTHDFIDTLKSLGHNVKAIDSRLEHILVSGMFTSFFEMVIHDMPKEQAVTFNKELRAFYTAGWKELMGM